MKLFHNFKYPLRRQGNLFRRLENESVATGDRIRQKPEWNDRGKIEWGDGCGYSQGLTDHGFVDPRCDVFEVVTLHQHRNPACNFNVLDSAAQFSPRFGKRLAILRGAHARELFEMLLKQR